MGEGVAGLVMVFCLGSPGMWGRSHTHSQKHHFPLDTDVKSEHISTMDTTHRYLLITPDNNEIPFVSHREALFYARRFGWWKLLDTWTEDFECYDGRRRLDKIVQEFR